MSDCEGLVEEVNHTAKFVTDLFSFVVVTRTFMLSVIILRFGIINLRRTLSLNFLLYQKSLK